jgi:hypothetical protein
MKVGDYEVTPPITSYNRGYLEGATSQKNALAKEVESLKRRARIFELKLVVSRTLEVVGTCSDHKVTAKALEDEEVASAELEAMNLTPEEKAL